MPHERIFKLFRDLSLNSVYNFEEHVAEKFALRQSLLDVEAELSKRRQSQEAAVRRAASYGDRLAYINRFIDTE